MALITSALMLTNCAKDTCNNALGNTFDSIELDSISFSSDDTLTTYFSTLTLQDLPNAYFESVFTYDSTTIAATTIECTSSTLRLHFIEGELPSIDSTRNYLLNFSFEDRRNYINCTHPGSADLYLLLLDFDLTRIDSTHASMSNFTWNEFFVAGHL